MCTQAASFFGAPDIVVNAAGINIRKPMLEVSDDDWDATLEINLAAPFFLCQALAPAMIAKGWGRIINIASLQSVRALPMGAAYGASKGGHRAADTRTGRSLVASRRQCQRDRARFLPNCTDRADRQRPGTLAKDGRQHVFEAQWRAARLAGHGSVPREPRVGLRDRSDNLRRRRILSGLISFPATTWLCPAHHSRSIRRVAS